MENLESEDLNIEMQSKLNQFKEYAVLHNQLARVDKLLMRAIREQKWICSCVGLWTKRCG